MLCIKSLPTLDADAWWKVFVDCFSCKFVKNTTSMQIVCSFRLTFVKTEFHTFTLLVFTLEKDNKMWNFVKRHFLLSCASILIVIAEIWSLWKKTMQMTSLMIYLWSLLQIILVFVFLVDTSLNLVSRFKDCLQGFFKSLEILHVSFKWKRDVVRMLM